VFFVFCQLAQLDSFFSRTSRACESCRCVPDLSVRPLRPDQFLLLGSQPLFTSSVCASGISITGGASHTAMSALRFTLLYLRFFLAVATITDKPVGRSNANNHSYMYSSKNGKVLHPDSRPIHLLSVDEPFS